MSSTAHETPRQLARRLAGEFAQREQAAEARGNTQEVEGYGSVRLRLEQVADDPSVGVRRASVYRVWRTCQWDAMTARQHGREDEAQAFDTCGNIILANLS